MILGVLLAAGRSSRFSGAQKLVAMLGGQPVVRSSAAALLGSGVDRVIVVLGSDADGVRAALAGLPVTFALNERYAEGLSGSLRVGVQAALSLGSSDGLNVEAVVLALGDQPTVASEVASALIDRFRAEQERDARGAQIVAARYEGERSHPALFARSVFAELLDVSGDQGAREVITRDPARVAYVDIAGAPPADVDTRSDLEAMEQHRRST